MTSNSKTAKIIICIIFAAALINPPVNASDYTVDITPLMQTESYVLMDGGTGQVLLEKNMSARMYPASITKVMTALLAFESGAPLSSVITMSYDAVWSVGRDTSHIALDVDEQLTLEQALYALAIESGNDAANGIAELLGGTMENFAAMMSSRAIELGAADTHFANAHGLPEPSHYTTARDMALIMAAAIKYPEFNKIFGAVTYSMPPTNKQPEPRTFNRKHSLNEGMYAYGGLLAEKTGWTSDAGYTYVSAASRGGRSLVLVLMRSPDPTARWEDATRLFDYGFDAFTSVSFTAEEIAKENYAAVFAGGVTASMRLVPEGGFDCLILKSLSKADVTIGYALYADGGITGKAVFSLGAGAPMYNVLGEAGMRVYLDAAACEITLPEQGGVNEPGEQQGVEGAVAAALAGIYKVVSLVLQIIGAIAVLIIIYYIRRYIAVRKIKKQRRLQGGNGKQCRH